MKDPVTSLECGFADFCEVPYVLAVTSGTAALLASLLALGVGRGMEVILCAYTWPQLAAAMEALGLKVKAVDCDPYGRMDPEAVGRALSPRTGTVVVCHLFGNPADARRISELAGEAGVAVIEDCSQALLAWQGGRRVGTWGQIGFASLGPGKILSGGGGGLLWTSDRHLHREAFALTQHPDRTPDLRLQAECLQRSLSLRIHPAAARMAGRDLLTLEERGARVGINHRFLCDALTGVPGIQLMAVDPEAVAAWQCLPLKVSPSLAGRLERLWWRKQPAYLLQDGGACPQARDFADSVRFLETGRKWAQLQPAFVQRLTSRIRAAACCGD